MARFADSRRFEMDMRRSDPQHARRRCAAGKPGRYIGRRVGRNPTIAAVRDKQIAQSISGDTIRPAKGGRVGNRIADVAIDRRKIATLTPHDVRRLIAAAGGHRRYDRGRGSRAARLYSCDGKWLLFQRP